MNKGVIVVLLALVCIAAPVMADPPAPFVITGWVNCTDGTPVNDPSVTVTNTEEEFVVETAVGSNYYRVVTHSPNVSTNDVLSFDVDGVTAATHWVTQANMDAGGFTQNITIDCEPAGTCGDVNCQDGVDMADAIQIAMGTIYGTGAYPLADPWAADVNCEDGVDMADAIQIAMGTIYGTGAYPLECCD